MCINFWIIEIVYNFWIIEVVCIFWIIDVVYKFWIIEVVYNFWIIKVVYKIPYNIRSSKKFQIVEVAYKSSDNQGYCEYKFDNRGCG